MLRLLNIHCTNVNHDGFLEMDANVIVAVREVSGNAVEMQH